MKKSSVILLFILFSFGVNGQIAFYDADSLKKMIIPDPFKPGYHMIKDSERSKALKILAKYIKDVKLTSFQMSDNEVSDAFRGNPFIGPDDSLHPPLILITAKKHAGLAEGIKLNMPKSLGGLDVTNFADGLAQFMVERAKEELNIAFFQNFYNVLDDPRFSDLKILFADTYLALKQADKQIYNPKNYLQSLREAMQRDLSQLFESTYTFLSQQKYDSLFRKYPEMDLLMRGGLRVAELLQHKKHPGEIISLLAKEKFSESAVTCNFSSSMKLLDMFSQSLRCEDTSRYWINMESYYSSFSSRDTVFFQIYLGLIYASNKYRYQDISFRFPKQNKEYKISDYLDSVAYHMKDYYQIRKFIRDIIQKGNQITDLMDLIRDTSDNREKPDFTFYYRFFNASLDILEVATEIQNFSPKIRNALANVPYENYMAVARAGSDLTLNIYNKEYSSAVSNVGIILENIFFTRESARTIEGLFTETKDTIRNIIKSDSRGVKKNVIRSQGRNYLDQLNDYLKDPVMASKPDNTELIAILADNMNDYQNIDSLIRANLGLIEDLIILLNLEEMINLLLKYGLFAANLVNASSPEEVKSALEAAAMPVGSYRVKRQTNFNISLNGFVGAAGGIQFGDERDWLVGAWAPVGPAFSWGNISRTAKHKSSISIFVPVIDIGALALFRISNDTTELQSKITFNQILAPGLFASYGIPGLPVNVSLGYQIAPLLKSANTGQPVINDKNYGRILLTISVDIPFFNIYSSSNSKIKSGKIKNLKGKIDLQ